MAKVPSCLLVTGLVGVMACFINVNGSTVRVSGSGRLDSLNYGIWLNPVKKKKVTTGKARFIRFSTRLLKLVYALHVKLSLIQGDELNASVCDAVCFFNLLELTFCSAAMQETVRSLPLHIWLRVCLACNRHCLYSARFLNSFLLRRLRSPFIPLKHQYII